MEPVDLPWNPWRVFVEQLPHISLVMLLANFHLGWEFGRKIGTGFGDTANFHFLDDEVKVQWEGVTFYLGKRQVRELLGHIDTLASEALVGIDSDLMAGNIDLDEAKAETALLRVNMLNERRFVPWSLNQPIGIEL